MAVPIRIELLGKFRLNIGRESVSRLETGQTTELLAYLCLFPERVHQREELCELLWTEGASSATRHRLTQAISAIRKTLDDKGSPDILIVDRNSVQLNAELVQSDVLEFRYLIELAKKEPRLGRKVELLSTAIGMYRGDFLPDHYSDWVQHERWGLSQEHLFALRELASAYEQSGDLDGAIDCYTKVVTLDSLDENGHCDLIEALVHAERYTSALRQYSVLEQTLKDELGLAPGERAMELLRKAKKLSVSHRRPSPSADKPRRAPTPDKDKESASTSRLPQTFTRFFGREDDIQQALWILRSGDRRLITFTGPGGTGKTRLSIELGRRAEKELGAEFIFVPLADALDEGTILDATLNAMGVKISSHLAKIDQIVEFLENDRGHWLILDNFDHLVSLAPKIVSPLLERVPGLRVIVTSRSRLNIQGELELPLKPLPIPEAASRPEELYRYPSVQLFVDRAQAANSAFKVNSQNANHVAELCKGLEGIPLAVELAAAWIPTMTPGQMVTELTDRFSLLVSKRTDIEGRHKTLHAAIHYSYDLLSPELRKLFTNVSVFRGGWTTDACVKVCHESEATLKLAQLHELSLIMVEEDTSVDTPVMRYRMLDSIREFAWELMNDKQREEISRPHALYFSKLAEEAQVGLVSHEQEYWLAKIDRDVGNFVEALKWSIDAKETKTALQIGVSVALFWELRGYFSEGKEWLQRLLDMSVKDKANLRLRAQALMAMGRLTWYQASYQEAEQAHREALGLLRELEDQQGIAEALYNLGITLMRQSNLDDAEQCIQESLEVAESIQDQLGVTRAYLNLGNLALERADAKRAMEFYEESRAIARLIGNKERELFALNNLANAARGLGLIELSAAYIDEGMRLDRQLGSKLPHSLTGGNMATICLSQGDIEGALHHISRALRLSLQIGSLFSVQSGLLTLGQVARDKRQYRSLGKILGGIRAIGNEIGYPLPPTLSRTFDPLLVEIKEKLSEHEMESAMKAGELMTIDEIVEFALNVRNITGEPILQDEPTEPKPSKAL